MKLTHENVRTQLERTGCDGNCGFDGCRDAMFRVLAEQWLAAHTVRWTSSALHTGLTYSPHTEFAFVDSTGAKVTATIRRGVQWRTFATEAEARAWCEEQASAEGFEVER